MNLAALTCHRPLASYSAWADWCRHPLLWLGRADPVAKVFDAINADPERARLDAFMQQVESLLGTAQFQVKDLITRATDMADPGAEELLDVLKDITGDNGVNINRKRLGHWVRQHQGRVVQGRKIVRAPVNRNTAVWRIERIT